MGYPKFRMPPLYQRVFDVLFGRQSNPNTDSFLYATMWGTAPEAPREKIDKAFSLLRLASNAKEPEARMAAVYHAVEITKGAPEITLKTIVDFWKKEVMGKPSRHWLTEAGYLRGVVARTYSIPNTDEDWNKSPSIRVFREAIDGFHNTLRLFKEQARKQELECLRVIHLCDGGGTTSPSP
jgi:hypothetical protein